MSSKALMITYRNYPFIKNSSAHWLFWGGFKKLKVAHILECGSYFSLQLDEYKYSCFQPGLFLFWLSVSHRSKYGSTKLLYTYKSA